VAFFLHHGPDMQPSSIKRPLVMLLIGLGAACTGGGPDDQDTCADGRCDIPDDPAEVSCTRRRSDAFNENRLAFNDSFLRWSCADVQGVTFDDRGQEYCEYFAIAQLPETATASVLGKNLGPDSTYGATETAATLTATQIAALEADETQVVGQCVFSSWNSDIPGPVPACDGTGSCPTVVGLPIDEDTFRMKFDVNSADAAQILVEDCLTYPTAGDAENPKDLRHDDFMRGCLWNADINQTEFRKSDSTICSSMTRLAECGCSVTTGEKLSELISPFEERGFRLGGWSGFVAGSEAQSDLPANCRYVDLGDGSQTLVTCDLTAGDLLYGAADVKQYCAEKYADNIVVHVPVPKTKVTCDPSTSTSPYADTCSATPWIVTPSVPAGS
jgi:hypothetical protein